MGTKKIIIQPDLSCLIHGTEMQKYPAFTKFRGKKKLLFIYQPFRNLPTVAGSF